MWNTWDVQAVNAIVNLEHDSRITLGLYDEGGQVVYSTFTWRDGVARLGHHSFDGRYAALTLDHAGQRVDVEYGADDDLLVCRVIPQNVTGLRLAVRVTGAVELVTSVEPSGHADDWALFGLDAPVVLSAHPDTPAEATAATGQLDALRDAALSDALQTGGWLDDAADGLVRSITWNSIWEPIKGRVCTPVSRDWCRNPNGFGGYVLFDWDTFFCAVMAQLFDPDLALANVRAILQEVTPGGFVPNFGSANGASEDRSQPPVGAYSVLKIYHLSALADENKNTALLAETFPALLRWHDWWLPHRDGNNDGLLEWGSDPLPEGVKDWESFCLKGAMYESGLDNSPMWDDTVFNAETHTMELAAVGLNALYALDAWALAEMAHILGYDDDARRLMQESRAMQQRINAHLWDDDTGMYLNRHWSGDFSPVLSTTLFFPMLAGIVPPDRAEDMVQHYLLNSAHFWGEYVVPTVPRSEPAFAEQDYWRGRVWPPHNYLIAEGLRRSGFDETAFQMAVRSLKMFLTEWHEHGHVHENLNAQTGRGDARGSDPMYTWGALMAYIAIQEMIDAEVWAGWRFGNLSNDRAQVRNVRVAEGRLRIETGQDGLHVGLNDAVLFQTDCPAMITELRRSAGWMAFRLRLPSTRTTDLVVGDLPPAARIRVTVDEREQSGTVNDNGTVTIPVTASCNVSLRWGS